jgi:nucleotidyltransferase substrate binding protein (TIGR01987 family)
MERLKERLGIAHRALQSLEELLVIEKPSRIERDAAIQRFEYTFEAAWKAAERFLLVVEGVAAVSPKGCVRMSREAGLLTEEQAVVALEMVDDRNLTVHTYNEQLAERIHRNLARYGFLLRDWLSAMNDRLAGL